MMPTYLGVNHRAAVKALEKAGFRIALQGKYIVMTDGTRIVTVPRHNPVNAITMANIIRDAGLDCIFGKYEFSVFLISNRSS